MGGDGLEDKNIIITGWVKEHTEEMFSWAFYKTSDRALAEDLVQDTFLAAHRGFDKFEGASSPKTWLFSILRNKITDYYRSAYKNKFVNERNISPEASGFGIDSFFSGEAGDWHIDKRPATNLEIEENLLDDEDFMLALKECMDGLPEKHYLCMQLKYLKEMDGKVICQELEISPSNFWQILHRAKLKLRDCLEITWFKS